MAGLGRRVETFTAGYFGAATESTPFTVLPMQDLDSPPLGKNFAIQDRTKQYWDIATPVQVYVSGVLQPAANYTVQRLGGIVRFATAPAGSDIAAGVAPTSPATATTGGTILPGTYLIGYTYTTAGGQESALSATASQVVPNTTNTNTVTTGAAAALPAGANGVNWYMSLPGGTVANMYRVGNAATVTGITVTVPPSSSSLTPNALTASNVTVSCNYIPTYFMAGARALGNARTAAKIDTTGSGDPFMNAVPGRPDATMSFTLVTGPKIVNALGKTVTLENFMVAAAQSASVCVCAFQDDTTDPLLPRDAMYVFIANANKTRAMGAAVERAVDGYLAPCADSLPLLSIDYIA